MLKYFTNQAASQNRVVSNSQSTSSSMKKIILLLFTVCCLFSQQNLLANTIIVKGYVKDSTGNPVANRNVKIFTNDSSQGCIFTHTVVTNPNGYYIDTVSCTGSTNIKNLFVKVENCNGVWIVQNPTANNTSGYIEVNFVICRPVLSTPAPCKALFNYTLTETGVKFSGTPSEIPPGDSIISRFWEFGDGTRADGNLADPWHEYKKAGSYTVCLTIKTKKGCQSNYCKTILFQPRPIDSCVVDVHANVERMSIKKFRFTSNTVKVGVGDSIIKRTWTFGDGTSLSGNEVYPIKEYKDTGVYTICVKVKTARGCEAQHCFTVVARDTIVKPAGCKAHFSFTYKDSVAYFNSASSTAPSGDSIISRTWLYINGHDTLKLGGNVVDTFIKYYQPGVHTVYLIIKTKKGCESKFAGEVKIPAPPAACRLQVFVSVEKLSPKKFRFSSSQSSAPGDSIIKRKWKFSDGTIIDGNEISPLKEFKDTGVYSVCVYLKTKSGCEKEYCVQVVVKDSTLHPVPTNCKADFTFTVQNNVVKFNSKSSTAPQGDSIIGRTWIFGDNTPTVTNLVDPSHTYAKHGAYTVYLYIKTKNGCENKYTGKVVIDSAKPVECKVNVQFVASRISGKKVQFNSLQSATLNNDSIVSRTWKFGDGTILQGNEISPVKEFPLLGVYNTCLEVKTKNGCIASVCKQVMVQDSLNAPESSLNFVKIISLNPNPVTTRMLATIYSRNANTEVEIAVYDIYGAPKFSFKKMLSQGNNIIEVVTAHLYRGPYFLKVSSRSSKDSKMFYKL